MIRTRDKQYVCFESARDLMENISLSDGTLFLLGVPFLEEQKPKKFPAFFRLCIDDDIPYYSQGNYQQPIIDYLYDELYKIEKKIFLFEEDMNG